VGSTNATYDTIHNYTWDADGNSITVDAVGVTYDALDRAVEQNRSGTYTQIVYAPSGAKLALMSGATLQKAFVALPGQGTVVYTSSGLDHYRHSDWLGSARLTSSPSQTVISTTAYAPFGEAYAQSTGTSDLSFTGMNQDTVTGALSGDYDFLYREYNTQGRWPQPDPAGLAAANPANPQSWNRYAYVLNNPLGFVDPLGLDCMMPDGTYEDGSTIEGSWMSSCSDAGGQWINGTQCLDAGYASACISTNGINLPMDTSGFPYPSDSPQADPDGLDWGPNPSDSSGNGSVGGNSSGGGSAASRSPSFLNRAISWTGCVATTTLKDAAWGAVLTPAVGIVGSTVIMGAAGTSIGVEGTVAGAELGFAIGVGAAPALAVEGGLNGALLGVAHGAIACSFSRGG
jgi:RHS repeat-associated protein